MSQNERQVEIVISRDNWESFLSSLERLMALHRRTLERLNDLRLRNEALRTELSTALALPTLKSRTGQEAVGLSLESLRCEYCGRVIQADAKFCDRCGGAIDERPCQCGRICNKRDRFCDLCGRVLAGN